MLNSFRKDLAAQLGTVECNRCDLCDKTDGLRVRLACGQSACADCVAKGECPTCLPLMDSKTSRPHSDDPPTEGAKHSELLASPDTLEQAVYQKQRISERLRVEKELFPECIQAPVKYSNKRKSLNVSKRGKENKNTTYFPGEEISSSRELTMNKSRNFVQEWLSKQPNTSFSPLSRSPFSDLKVNTHHKQAPHSTPVKHKQKENAVKLPTRLSNRKRSRLKQSSTVSQSSLETYLKPQAKGKNTKAWPAKKIKQEFDDSMQHLDKQCDESGIVIDDDCFTIEDTQDQIVDKDKLALIEVEKANLLEMSKSVIVIGDTEELYSVNEGASTSMAHETVSHVPFYKKSLLFENCDQCITACQDTLKSKSPDNAPKKSSDVSITVENNSFITTISIVDCNPVNFGRKQSTAVQTEVEEPFLGFDQPTQRETVSLIAKIKEYIETKDVSTPTEHQDPRMDSQKTSCTNILKKQDGMSKAAERVDVNKIVFDHSNEHDFGVLTALDGAGFQKKRKRGERGATPDSNNSSDKENFDPNRKKKGDAKKKKKNKS